MYYKWTEKNFTNNYQTHKIHNCFGLKQWGTIIHQGKTSKHEMEKYLQQTKYCNYFATLMSVCFYLIKGHVQLFDPKQLLWVLGILRCLFTKFLLFIMQDNILRCFLLYILQGLNNANIPQHYESNRARLRICRVPLGVILAHSKLESW